MDYQQINATLSDILAKFDLNQPPGGGSLTIFHQGKLVTDLAFGVTHQITQPKWTSHTLSLNYSTGKGVLVMLIHILVNKGLLDYDTPISQYWQAFASQGKQNITLRHVLSHEAGLIDINSVTKITDDVQDWQAMLHKVAHMPVYAKKLASQNEKFVAYSALVSGWVLGGLIEIITHMPLQQALDTFLTEPLGIKDQVFFALPADKNNQIAIPKRVALQQQNLNSIEKLTRTKPTLAADDDATLDFLASLDCYPCWQKIYQQKNSTNADNRSTDNPNTNNHSKKRLNSQEINQLYFNIRGIDMADYKASLVPKDSRHFDYYQPHILQSKVPAANVIASGYAMAKIYNTLLHSQKTDTGLISPPIFAQLTSIQNQQVDKVMPAQMNWRLGYHRIFSVCHDTADGFGHTGYNGSMAWCDPARGLAVAFVHNYDVTMLTDVRQFIINETVLNLFH
ncbi:beta-lactamase [Moraxella macacae 0408225]|uniref:Beta-lactamase n=1 Tax=Moraxella macacae 0408225 TaxID=1230338 RepID=L2F633_9GAMM|nr:serine hydrolase domain-containing protein [Moraxella macacae]ELA08365.1 beta-lactamase [Moraxella macacae 0408225]